MSTPGHGDHIALQTSLAVRLQLQVSLTPDCSALTVSPRLPVLSLFTLKDQFIAFAGSVHVVIMNLKKKEQHVILIN